MPGVVAAGQRQTAEAAAAILRRGGNPVDAAIAACAAAFMAEPLLCSAGGAGIMTVALDGEPPQVVDFFSDMPGRGAHSTAPGHFEAIHVSFGVATQTFHVGRASAAVPGTLPGLAAAHARFGSLPLPALLAPAIEMCTDGIAISAETAHVFGLLWDIVSLDPETAETIAGGQTPPRPGTVLRNPALADTLSAFGEAGRTPQAMVDAMVTAFGPERGGLITETDVRAYEPRVGPPVQEQLGDWTLCAPTSPGGRLALLVSKTLAAAPVESDEAAEIARTAQASRAAHLARAGATSLGSTTHISILVPGAGVCAVTLTNGEGAGIMLPGTGVQMNNFLGEEDLNPHGFHRHPPGLRLPTMIAPSVALRRGIPCLALGSGGSNRIRSAVGEVLYRRTVLGMPLEQAVNAPRVHAETDAVWFEGAELSDPEAARAALAASFPSVYAFPGRDFFFGGVHAVEVDDHGHVHGVGDARRGGVALQL